MAADILTEIRAAGVALSADGSNLVATPKAAITDNLRVLIRAHKPELLAALQPQVTKINRWRVTHADGQVTEHSSRGLTRSEALDLARSFGEPVQAEPVPAVPPSPPGNLDALPGVSPEFAARLDAEDLKDIAAGDIPVKTVQAFEQAAIAREAEDLREHFEERAGILEHDAGLPRADAELEAAKIAATLIVDRDGAVRDGDVNNRPDARLLAGIQGVVDEFFDHHQRPVPHGMTDLGDQFLLTKEVQLAAGGEGLALEPNGAHGFTSCAPANAPWRTTRLSLSTASLALSGT